MSQRTRRSALCFALLVPCLSGVGQAQESPTFERLEQVDWDGWEDLPGLLSDVHERTGVPAIAAAFVRDGRIVAQATVGVRAFGSTEQVGPDDRFHLGSVTKSFTACVIGKLVEEGKLGWDTQVGQVLAGVEMQEAYRAVTVEQLLQHLGGLPAYTESRPAGHDPDEHYSGSPGEQRAAFIADALVQAPVGTPGRTALYSNAGYALAGHMAERVAGESWERLVRRFVFDPLAMQHSGFGFPDQPLGHAGDGPEFRPVPLDAYPPMKIIAPAGNIHGSVSDLARYARAHLAGIAGRDGWLLSETVRRLHAVPEGRGEMQFASGWIVTREATGGTVHSHAGTVGASYAEIRLYPARNSAVIVLTTVSLGVGEAVANKVSRALLRRFTPAVSGFVSAGQASTSAPVVEGEATAEEDARLWRIVKEMSEAINDEDRKAFHALFAPAYDRRDGDRMFDFMARNVLPARGGVHGFHALGPPLDLPGSDRPHRSVMFHLENGFPGYYGFSLDDEGRILEFSLFVKGDLCTNGTDRNCARIVKTLDEDFE